MCIVFCGKYQLATLGRYGSGRGDFWACYPCRWKRKKVARWEGCVRVVAGSRGKVLGDASARQCGRQQSQALCKVVVRVFWRDLAHIRLTFRPALLPPPPPPVHLPRLCPLSAPGFRTSLLRLCGRKRPCDMRPLGRAKAPYEATADQSEKLQEEVGCHRCKFG